MAAFLLVLLQAYLVAEYSGQSSFSLAVILAAVLSIQYSVQIPTWLHLLFGIVFVSVCWISVDAAPPEIVGDWILSGRYVIAISRGLIVLQLLELIFRSPAGISIRFAALAMAGLLVAFCRYESPANSLMFYFVAVLALTLFGLLFRPLRTYQFNGQEKSIAGSRWIGVALLAVSLSIGTIYFASFVKYTSNLLRFVFLSEYVEAQETGRAARIAYSATGNLDSVTRFQKIDPNRIALYATCDVPPGYLRGRVFSKLSIDGWKTKAIDFRSRSLQSIRTPESIDLENDFRCFSRQTKLVGPYRRVRVRHAPFHIGNIVFTPLGYELVACNGGPVICNEHDVVCEGVKVRQSYDSYVPRPQSDLSLESFYQSELLQIPNSIRNRVSLHCAEKIGTGSDLDKIRAVEQYFRSNYLYSLESFEAPSLDRISYFILQQPAAHCEYFATGAAVMLRLAGIPARYVTGFIVDEYDDDEDNLGDQWIARNSHAHAWVEAFDRQQQKWIVVEATPNIFVPKDLWNDQRLATIEARVERVEEGNKQFGFQSMVAYAWFLFQRYGLQTVNTLVSVFMIAVLYWLYRRQGVQTSKNSYALKQHARKLRRLERRLRKSNLVRARSETLHQFADRIRKQARDANPWIEECASFIKRYAELRYSASV